MAQQIFDHDSEEPQRARDRVVHAWDAFLRHPVTEADVDAELRRHPPRR